MVLIIELCIGFPELLRRVNELARPNAAPESEKGNAVPQTASHPSEKEREVPQVTSPQPQPLAKSNQTPQKRPRSGDAQREENSASKQRRKEECDDEYAIGTC